MIAAEFPINPHTAALTLPDFLEQEDFGFVRLTGHRIGLHHVVRLYNEGYTPEMICEELPSLSLSKIHYVLGYYLSHREAVDTYSAWEEAEMRRQEEEYDTTRTQPLLQELMRKREVRQRIEQKRRAERRGVDAVAVSA